MGGLGIGLGARGLGAVAAARAAHADRASDHADWVAADSFDFAPAERSHAAASRDAGPASALDDGPGLTDGPSALHAPTGAFASVETLSADAVDLGDGPAAASISAPLASAATADAHADAQAGRFDVYTSGQGGLGVESDFNIQIVFVGDMPDALRQDFIEAAEYLSTLITGDIADRGRVDDIVIVAQVAPIDGEGSILGQAGPVGIRHDGSSQPFAGIMQFDVADAANLEEDGLFDDTVTHEMMHCLGFGTTWEQQGLVEGSTASGDIRFTGTNANLAYQAGGAPGAFANDPNHDAGVPVETDGGAGTAGGHWDEDLFVNELMTGYIDDPNYISPVTVAAFEDMGYETIWDASDPAAAMPQLDDLLAIA